MNQKTLSAIILCAALCATGAAQATVSFDIQYFDGSGSHQSSAVVGSGTFSYDGTLTTGAFSFDSLSNIQYTATINGHTFNYSNMYSYPNMSGINVFALGGSRYGMVFTGMGSPEGSFSLETGNYALMLAHEPTNDLTDRAGAFGGDGIFNQYFLIEGGDPPIFDLIGYYGATTEAIPEPAPLALTSLGIAALAGVRRKKAACKTA